MHVNYLAKVVVTLSVSLALATSCSTSSPSTSASQQINNDSQDTAVETAVTDTAVSLPNTGVTASLDELIAVEPSTAEAQNIRYFVDDSGLAIGGTDPVAYFTQGGPVTGSSEFVYTWRNATWQFASAENRDLFVANPEQYAPQYGGFCAWAVSQGYTASIDPSAWRIVDGKLYLNYNRGVQRQWERDIPGNIGKANPNWPRVLADS